jgi:hypothetical protein
MKTISFFLLFTLSIASCEYKDSSANAIEPACTPELVVSFSKEVHPIFNAKCAIPTCHVHTNQSLPFLTNFKEIKPNTSDIISQLSNRAMPPARSAGGLLTAHEKSIINCWVTQGSLDN